MSHQEKCEETVTKSVFCRRCANPLKWNGVWNIDEEIFKELCSSNYTVIKSTEKDDRNILIPILNRKLESSAMKKVILPLKIPEITNDFMVITELSSFPMEAESLKITSALDSLMSDNASIDYPVCEDCLDCILDQADSQLKSSEDELRRYQRFLRDYEDKDEDSLEELEAELEKLKAKEVGLEKQLNNLKSEEKSVKKLLQSHMEENEILEKKEKDMWCEYNIYKRKILCREDAMHSISKQLLYTQARLEKLTKTNVFEDTFHIWHSGPFGTINNFRLGRLPTEPVEWAEINAAWGQVVLLLHSLAKITNLKFQKYRLVPYGSHSYIVSLDNKSEELPLYSLGGSYYVLDNRFDRAMIAFLDCLQQFKERVLAGDETFCLPYGMNKGRIEDRNAGKSYLVKIHLNSHEQWTKAMKFMLTNLKWAVAWTATQFPKD